MGKDHASAEPISISRCWKFDAKSAALIREVDRVDHASPFQPAWDSLKQYHVPKWCEDARFGIFIHWGVYSVPAFGSEWYPRWMYKQGHPDFKHHVETYGPQSKFRYKDFVPLFKAGKFNPKVTNNEVFCPTPFSRSLPASLADARVGC
jgi:alpha-L-fucosidase